MIHMRLTRNVEIFVSVVSGGTFRKVAKDYKLSCSRIMEIYYRILQLILNHVEKGLSMPSINDVRKNSFAWIVSSNRLVVMQEKKLIDVI